MTASRSARRSSQVSIWKAPFAKVTRTLVSAHGVGVEAQAGLVLCGRYPRNAPEFCQGYILTPGPEEETCISRSHHPLRGVHRRGRGRALLLSEKTFASKYSSIMVTKLREAVSAKPGDEFVQRACEFRNEISSITSIVVQVMHAFA